MHEMSLGVFLTGFAITQVLDMTKAGRVSAPIDFFSFGGEV
jgi:hypothetical protein